jgi:hypothetical protein
MLSRNRLALRVVFSAIALFALAVLAGCGTNSTTAMPPPTGGFTNSDLNGTYVFSATGTDVNGAPISFAGVFVANGSGGIAGTGGVLDVVDPDFDPAVSSAVAITGGTYNVGVDGRPASTGGLLNLVTSGGTFTFDFVIASDQNGQIAYYSTNENYGGTGSGSYMLQSAVSQSNVDGQSYAFNVVGASVVSGTPFALAGAFTLDANGQVGVTTTGVEDVNNNNEAICGVAGCIITGGSINLANTPGTAAFSTSAGTFTFDVYPIDATDLTFIETDGGYVTTGNAFTQSSSIPSGNNVFSMAGWDSTAGGPITAVGLLATDGNGNVTTASAEDVNDFGDAGEVTGYSGTYAAVSGGRSLVTLTGFVKGDGGLGCSGCEFAAYPSTGGMILLEVDNDGFADGAAFLQSTSATTFASGAGYGMDLTGGNFSGEQPVEEDDIVEFTNTTGALGGIIDFNDEGSTGFDEKYTSAYTADTTVPGRGTVVGAASSSSYQNYVVDSSLSLGIVSDSTMVALGTLQTQASTGSSSSKVAVRHMLIPRIPHVKGQKAKRASH